MNEGFKTPGKESFSSRKDAVVAYIKGEIEKKKALLDSLDDSYRERRDSRKTREPLGPIPEEVQRDGGSDLSEWRAQVGADAYDREHGEEDDRAEMESLVQNIDDLGWDLEHILATQFDENDEQYDPRIFEKYLSVMGKPKL